MSQSNKWRYNLNSIQLTSVSQAESIPCSVLIVAIAAQGVFFDPLSIGLAATHAIFFGGLMEVGASPE
jgi:hypothetical protein